jgi:hypothetical protein
VQQVGAEHTLNDFGVLNTPFWVDRNIHSFIAHFKVIAEMVSPVAIMHTIVFTV